MEFFSIKTGNIKDDGRYWQGMVCGIVDFDRTEVLDDLSCYIDDAFECSIDDGTDNVRDFGDDDSRKIYKWIDLVRSEGGCKYMNTKTCDMLLIRNEYFFTSKAGWCVLNKKTLREKLLQGLNEFVWRNGTANETEKKLCAWLIQKILKVEVAWKE